MKENTIQAQEVASGGKTAEAISGRATGVLFLAGFGSIWLYNGISAMHRLNPISIAAVGVILAALMTPAAMLLRSASKTAHADSPEVKRAFARVNGMQWAAIVAAIVLFNLLHKQEFLTPAITFIVGAHLVPLARLFSYSAHFVTGGLLMAWATVIAVAFPPAFMPSLGAMGTAAILLGSAVYTLALAGRAAKSSLPSNAMHTARA